MTIDLNLDPPSKPQLKPQPRRDDQGILDMYIAEKSTQGWHVVSRSETSVQLRKPKQWSALGLILGFLLIIVFGIGLVIILLAIIDYLLKKDQLLFATIDDIEKEQNVLQQRLANKGDVVRNPYTREQWINIGLYLTAAVLIAFTIVVVVNLLLSLV